MKIVYRDPVPTQDTLTRSAFWQRFTATERESLQDLVATGTQSQKNKLNAFRDYVLNSDAVDLTDPYIVASVTLMEQAGVLTAGRAAAVLQEPVKLKEKK